MAESQSSPTNAEQVYIMVDKVRRETHLSHKLACHAVYVVVENLPSFGPSVSPILGDILKTLESPLEVADSLIDDTQDMARLFMISEDLDGVKNDAQQRSWELFDDQGAIMAYLEEFNCILMDADESISKRFLKVTQHYIVNCLAEYYQMESRWPIKVILLKTFDLLCTLSKTAVIILLQSVLPLELSRDVQSEHENKSRLMPALSVLTKMFSIGEPLPVIYFETIGKEFLLFLLQLIESPSSDPDQYDIVVQLTNFIVVYNLQFNDETENITTKALSATTNPKIFSETLLLLFNRAKDPVECVEHDDCPPNSLLKMIIDIFAFDGTCNLFYNNDIKVLIDIVLRQLIDNSPARKERNELLKLIKHILLRTDESVFSDRVTKIQDCVQRFSSEEEHENTIILIDEITSHISRINV